MNRDQQLLWQELQALIVEQLADELTDAQHERLEHLLVDDANARRIYLESMHDIGIVRQVLHPAESAVGESGGSVDLWSRLGRRALRLATRPVQLSLLTAALVLVIVLGTLAYIAVPTSHRTAHSDSTLPRILVAHVTGLYDVAWEKDQARVDYRSPLFSGDVLRLTRGVVEVTFGDGAVVLLEGPASLEMVGKGRGHLRSGKLTAEVPKRAQGFRIDTPLAPIFDLGTQFGVATVKDKSLEVHVFRGRVIVEAKTNVDKHVVLNAGQSLRLQRGGLATISNAVNPTHFVLSADYEAPQRWLDYQERLQTDADLIAYYSFQKDHVHRARLLNSGGARERLDGLVLSASWTNGRWTDKDALLFRGPSSHTYVDLGELSARDLHFAGPFSVAVWFRADGRGRDWPAIVTKGDNSWRLHLNASTGALAFGCSPAQPFDLYSETSVADGRWHLGVAVYEPVSGKYSKRLFVDGDLEAACEVDQPVAETNSPVFIGENADQLGREFLGIIDELAIFRRALSETEVAEMFAAGNPYAPPSDPAPPTASAKP